MQSLRPAFVLLLFAVMAASAKDAKSARPSKSRPAPAGPAGPAFSDEAQVGWSLHEAEGGKLLEGHEAGRNLTPGSTLKLFTTVFALETLGPDKVFETTLYRTGTVKDGVLQGDLVIRGGGDPGFAGVHLGSGHQAGSIFAAWHAALAKQGIRKVTGCVLGDGAHLVEEGPHPAGLWEDVGNYYAGVVSGLCYNDNLYMLTLSGASTAGRPVGLQGVAPRHAGIGRFDNRLRTGLPGGRDSAYILGGYPSPVRLLSGTYPAGKMPFTIKGSLPNPAWTCARELRDHLAARGIAFSAPDGPACGDSLALPNHPAPDYGQAVVVAVHRSAPLKELVRHTNQKSDNNYAAQLLALSGKASGKSGDFRGGLAAMGAWMGRQGFDGRGINFRDGTGLSRYNWVSPAQTAHLLVVAYRSASWPAFRASLVGAPGAEKKLERYGSGWNGRLLVKTGTLQGVASLAGYLRADSGRWLAFAVAANNFASRDEVEGGVVLRDDPQRAFEPLLRRWAKEF